MNTTGEARRRRRALCLALTTTALAATSSCRDFASTDSSLGGQGQTSAGAGGAPEAGAGAMAQAGAGTTIAGAGGEASAAGGADVGGAGGAGGAPPDGEKPETGQLGAVRLFIDGEPVCAGTLLNNSWVITADSCVPPNANAASLTIAYGADSANPDQVEAVSEIARFPGNDGTWEHRQRNLALLGAEHPFRIGGEIAQHHVPLWMLRGGIYVQLCAGWSFAPDAPDFSTRLRIVTLVPFATDLMPLDASPPRVGDRIWWVRTADRETGEYVLPTAQDLGGGCFYTLSQQQFILSLNTELPAERRDDTPNDAMEAVAVGLGDQEIHAWTERTMTSQPEYLPLPVALGPVTAEWSPQGDLEIVGVSRESQDLLWFTRHEGTWRDAKNLGTPPTGLSTELRPAALFRRAGDMELLAVDVDGALWWKRRFVSGEWAEWAPVESASTAITSGVHIGEQIVGHFHVVARGPAGELRHGEYNNGWVAGEWSDRGGAMLGEPAIDVPQEGRVNVFFTRTDGTLQVSFLANGGWGVGYVPCGAPYGCTLASSPALGRWAIDAFDFVGRLPNGRLARDQYMGATWSPGWNDLGIEMPEGDPVLALRRPGHGDLFVTNAEGQIWHVEWPRQP